MTTSRKSVVTPALLFCTLGVLQLVCALAALRYGRAVYPVLVSAAAFYIPAVGMLFLAGRSWTDVAVVGVIIVILASFLDAAAFPFGTFGLIAVHAFWAFGAAASELRDRSSRREVDEA